MSATTVETTPTVPVTLSAGQVTEVDGQSFDSTVLASDTPVLVDFYATWCGPCRALAPHLDRLAGERTEDLRVVKVDIDRAPELAERYGVQSIPTLVVFDAGDERRRKVGNPGGLRGLKSLID